MHVYIHLLTDKRTHEVLYKQRINFAQESGGRRSRRKEKPPVSATMLMRNRFGLDPPTSIAECTFGLSMTGWRCM